MNSDQMSITMRALDNEIVRINNDMREVLWISDDQTLNVMFSDLTKEGQEKVLDFFGIESEHEMNFDVFPVFILEKTDPED